MNKDYKRYSVIIKGTKPLLMNNPNSMNAPKEGKETPVEAMLYKNKKGQIYQPAEHILQMMKDSAYRYKGKKMSALVNAFLDIEPMEIIHSNQKYEIFENQVVIQKARISKKRPIFPEWKLEFTMISLDKQLTGNDLKDILEYAGTFNGLGDWSPRKGGRYGRFVVTKFKEI